MKHETPEELDALIDAWSAETSGEGTPAVKRIEDLPDLETVGAAEIEWVVDGIFAQGALHMLTSEPGAGKSTLVAAAGYAISLGREFAGRATSKRPVLILDKENPLPAIRERCRRLGIKTHADFHIWGEWVGEDPPSACSGIVLEWVARCKAKPVIVVDSVIAFHPGDENDSNATRRYMGQYRTLTAMGATIILLHHIGKSETAKDYRGSSDYKASIDIGYKLTNLGDPARLSTLELRPFKQRFSVWPVLHLRYADGTFCVDQAEGRKTDTDRLRDLLKENPNSMKSEFEGIAVGKGIGRNRARTFLDAEIRRGTVRIATGSKNRKLLSWTGNGSGAMVGGEAD